VQCGKEVTKPELPKADADTRLQWDVDLENSQRQREAPSPRPAPKEKESFPEVVIASDLENLHPLVKKTRAHLHELWSDKKWDERTERKRLDARIFETSLDRALVFLDALVRGVEAQGLKFRSELDDPTVQKRLEKANWGNRPNVSGCCWVEASGERVQFSLREGTKRVILTDKEKSQWQYRNWNDVPSGSFTFSIDSGYGFAGRTTWRDGKIQRLEQFLGEIVACFPLVGSRMRERRLAEEEAAKRRAAIDEMRGRLYQQKSQESRAVDKLFESFEQFRKAEALREFLEACRSKIIAIHGSPPDPVSRLGLWLRWVQARADMIDPLEDRRPPWNSSEFDEIIGWPKQGRPQEHAAIERHTQNAVL